MDELQKELSLKIADFAKAQTLFEKRLRGKRAKLDAKKKYLAELRDEEFNIRQMLHHANKELKDMTIGGQMLLEKYVDLNTTYAYTKADTEYRKLTALTGKILLLIYLTAIT